MKPFVRMPSRWIMYPQKYNGGLTAFEWSGPDRSDNIAALMVYIAIVHHVNEVSMPEFPEPGCTKLSYSELQEITGLSRKKISGGLKKLEALSIITTDKSEKTTVYKLVDNYFEKYWGKCPFQYLYDSGRQIRFFHACNLRKRVELDALKIYLLLIAFRDTNINHAAIAYPKMTIYTGVDKNRIRHALSLLVANELISVDQLIQRASGEEGPRAINYYRILGMGGAHFGNLDKERLQRQQEGASE